LLLWKNGVKKSHKKRGQVHLPIALGDFRLDYQRAHGDGSLQRAKRITCLPNGRNRIERRYRALDAKEAIVEEFITVDCIRPYSPDDLRQLAAWHELVLAEQIWDYGANDDPGSARFYTCAFIRK